MQNYCPETRCKVSPNIKWSHISIEFTFTQGHFVQSLFKIDRVVLEENFQKLYVFKLRLFYLPLRKGVALSLKRLECPSSKDALCQDKLKYSAGIKAPVAQTRDRECPPGAPYS